MSDLGSLSECLVDNDPAARVRARWLRSKALALSVALEALALASLLIWPLISPGSLVATSYFFPIMTPPHPGDSGSFHRPHRVLHSPPILDQRHFCRFCAPAVHPLAPANSSEAPDINASSDATADGPGPQGFGPGFIGGTGDRVMVPEPPHAEPPHVRPMLRSGEVMAAMLVNRVEPKYPTMAIVARISGTVHLRAIISKDGTVRELEVVDGNPLLAQAALVAVQNWRYQPTRLNGEPVEVETYVTVNFVLK
jgi:periplasmic protein TonB